MKVHIVWLGWDYEGDEIKLLTSNLDKATNCLEELNRMKKETGYGPDHLYVQTMEVDDT
jgi:hypothetical protein